MIWMWGALACQNGLLHWFTALVYGYDEVNLGGLPLG